ncbi:MAG: polyamine-transporting ATPase [Spirochaetes bacterium]|nr:MAG: polyamine-transporting ATPase [Spirochaetota bacterium]
MYDLRGGKEKLCHGYGEKRGQVGVRQATLGAHRLHCRRILEFPALLNYALPGTVVGFELPSQGNVTIQGADMTRVPVNKRGIGFVFQNYALFPHMSVDQNVAYGLKSRGEKDEAIWPKVKKALDLVGLGATGHRFPNQLSEGEQQRVALARVLVMEPTLLLMDGPLSNLDAKLRIHMRTEIRKIQKKLGITCLYVTHDQAEALTMADRVVVMNKGKVEQVGAPKEIYANPSSLFVADLIGCHVEHELDLGSLGLISAEQAFDPGVPVFEEGAKVYALIDPANAIFLP